MSIRVHEALSDEVTILRIAGRVTLGEGSSVLRDMVRRVVSRGDKWILIDLNQVSYIDSSGIGELVGGFTIARNAGASFKLFNLTKRIRDLLQNTKLYTVFEVFGDEKEATRSFRGGLTYSYCPLCLRFRTRPPTEDAAQWQAQSCMLCEAGFTIDPHSCDEGYADVRQLTVQTYLEEYLHIEPGSRYLVQVLGRLNRFSGSILKAAWQHFPSPRRVILTLDERTEVEEMTREVVSDLIRTGNSGENEVVLLLQGPQTILRDSFITVVPTYIDMEGALGAMEGLSDAKPWWVPIMEK